MLYRVWCFGVCLSSPPVFAIPALLVQPHTLFAHSRGQIHTSSSDAPLKPVLTHLATLIFWSVFTGDFLTIQVWGSLSGQTGTIWVLEFELEASFTMKPSGHCNPTVRKLAFLWKCSMTRFVVYSVQPSRSIVIIPCLILLVLFPLETGTWTR